MNVDNSILSYLWDNWWTKPPRLILLAFILFLVVIPPVSASGGVDDSYTKLLIHFDSGTWTDEAGHALTYNSSPAYVTSPKKFGTGAAEFNNGFDLVRAGASADWNLTTAGDFTVDLWAYSNGVNASHGVLYSSDCSDTYGGIFLMKYANTRNLVLYMYNGTSYAQTISSSGVYNIPDGEWQHIAIERLGSEYRLYCNGTMVANSTSFIGTPKSDANDLPAFGGRLTVAQGWDGYIDEARFSRGVARYPDYTYEVPVREYRTTWHYTSAGTFYWEGPVGLTKIAIKEAGGGGSGSPGLASSSGYGLGGNPSTAIDVSSITIVPGTNYTIQVGDGGAKALIGSPGNTGNPSVAFGHSAPGGSPGTLQAYSGAHNGGPGVNSTYWSTYKLGSDGGFLAQLPSWNYTGGAGGYGCGSGGGGGAGATGATSGDGSGGKGAPGFVSIYDYDYVTTNQPDFTVDVDTGFSGSLFHFTDTSKIRDAAGLTYTWDFGDGTTSDVMGNVMHVYSYTGTYDVSLTINTTSTSVTETKTQFITITTQQQELNLGAQPIPVNIRIVDGYSVPLQGATVNIWYQSSSLPNTSTPWLVSLLGVDATVAEEIVNSSLVMSQATGGDGSMTFQAFPGLGYTIQAVNASIGLNHTSAIVIKDNQYTLHCPLASQQKTNNTLQAMQGTWLPWYKVNTTAYRLQVNYTDTSGATTDVRFIVKFRNGTELYNHTQAYTGGTLVDNYTVNNLPMGTELIWKYNATKAW